MALKNLRAFEALTTAALKFTGSTPAANKVLTSDASGNASWSDSITAATIKLTGGTPAAGKVMTSDATGNASWATAASGPTYVTSLPGSPTDGQEIYFGADASQGIIWHLRYRSGASGSYKWEYVGGSPLTGTASDQQTCANSSYITLTNGPSLTLPALAGDYLVEYGVSSYVDSGGNSGGNATVALGGTEQSGTTAIDRYKEGSWSGWSSGSTRHRFAAVAASTVIDMRYRTDNTSPGTYFRRRYLRIIPVRVG